MKTLAHDGHRQAAHGAGDGAGGLWAALLVVAVLALAVWGAWKLGVMAGEKADWRQRLPEVPAALRKVPNPQPPPIPLQRRPGVAAEGRE